MLSSFVNVIVAACICSSALWWCPGCNLGYPHRTKTCLNKECPYYKQPRVKK